MLQAKTEPDISRAAGTLAVVAVLGASFPQAAQLMLRGHARSGDKTQTWEQDTGGEVPFVPCKGPPARKIVFL